jgi:hypothetical protein
MFQSTPASRNRARDNAARIGKLQNYVTTHPATVYLAALMFILVLGFAGGLIESIKL